MEILKALQRACDTMNSEKVEQLLLQNPTAFGAGTAGVLKLKGLTAAEVWTFCSLLPEGVALPTIEFKDCEIYGSKAFRPRTKARIHSALTDLTSHTGLRGLGFRSCCLSKNALTQLADGAEQRQKRGDRGLQVLYFDCDGPEEIRRSPSRHVVPGYLFRDSCQETFGSTDMARLIANSSHLERLMITDTGGSVLRSQGGDGPRTVALDLSEAIGALGGLKHLQTLVIKSLRPDSLCDENVAIQWRRLAENPPPIATIVLADWVLDGDQTARSSSPTSDDASGEYGGDDTSGECGADVMGGDLGNSGDARSNAWVDGLKAFCEFVARIPGCVTVQVARIEKGNDACNVMQMLGDALNSRTEPFNLHVDEMGNGWNSPTEPFNLVSKRDRYPVFIRQGSVNDEEASSRSISGQTAILEKLSGSAPVHSLQFVLGADEWDKDSTPVRAITGVLNRVGGLQRLALDIHDYERARRDHDPHDARSDLLAAIDAHPSMSYLALRESEPSESFRPEEDPDWKRLILAKRIQKVVQQVPIDNLQGEVTRPLMEEQDASPVVHRRWADQIRAQLNQQNHNL